MYRLNLYNMYLCTYRSFSYSDVNNVIYSNYLMFHGYIYVVCSSGYVIYNYIYNLYLPAIRTCIITTRSGFCV